MVRWYNPRQLISTGIEVFISSILGRHSDYREFQANTTAQPVFDYSKDDCEEFWLDYVADCADGGNSTYEVARQLVRDHELRVESKNENRRLERGRVLVFGGDMVYPLASREQYRTRLVQHYVAADRRPPSDDGPDAFGIPGNHDWYDSLKSFRDLFCRQAAIASWQTKQTRSYFAILLPGRWWLLGVDVQLNHDIDLDQLDYFSDLIADPGTPGGDQPTIQRNDRVILCTPEPDWIRALTDTSTQTQAQTENLDRLRERLDTRLMLSIAGDLHHYRRYSSADASHLITCGCGGAFTHPTHELPKTAAPDGFTHAMSFPKARDSRRLTRRNLQFPFLNKYFGLAPAFAYLLVAWSNGVYLGTTIGEVEIAELGRTGLSDIGTAIVAGFHSASLNPVGMALYLMIFGGFVLFTDSRSKWFRVVAGTIHGAAHVVAGFFVFWLSAYAAVTWLSLTPKEIGQYLVTGTLILTLGYLVGSGIVGLYLFVSLNWFHQHSNEAFSSLQIQDWKGFLRFRIPRKGPLEAFFIGIERVPRKWRAGDGTAMWDPDDNDATDPQVVDSFSAG